jgi:hypothetical protein
MKESKLPIQSQPVERTIAGTLISNRNGIETSNVYDDFRSITVGDIIDVATGGVGVAVDALGGLFG